MKKKRMVTSRESLLSAIPKKPKNDSEALEIGLTLLITAETLEQMKAAMDLVKDLMKSMPYDAISEVMQLIEGRLDTLERRIFGNVVEDLKTH